MCDAATDFFKGMNLGTLKESPAHMVKISKPFEIGKYVVTQGQWQTVMEVQSQHIPKGDNFPAENVNWNQVRILLPRSILRTMVFKYRLPTEAEWDTQHGLEPPGPTTATSMPLPGTTRRAGHQRRLSGKRPPNAWGLYTMFRKCVAVGAGHLQRI
jgi:formylglycine-generating enzyme required for sulfatase activity